jgi:hypothetical protein
LAPHWLLVHVASPFVTAGHALLQPLQLAGSDVTSTHEPVQFVSPDLQATVQALSLQTALPPHPMPHLPQLSWLLVVSTSQPFSGLPSQSARPASQAPTAQAPPVLHVAVAYGMAHGAQLGVLQPQSGSVTETHCPPHCFIPL